MNLNNFRYVKTICRKLNQMLPKLVRLSFKYLLFKSTKLCYLGRGEYILESIIVFPGVNLEVSVCPFCAKKPFWITVGGCTLSHITRKVLMAL